MPDMFVNIILSVTDDEFYRAKRYKTPLTLLLIENTDIELFDILEKNSRRLDLVQQLNTDTIFVYLTHTNFNEAELYIQKIKKLTPNLSFNYLITEYNKEDKSEFVRGLLRKFL